MFTGYDDEDDDYGYDNDYEDSDRYISKEDSRPDNNYHSQEFACPNCGSYNTGQSTYNDYCNTCDWYTHYD